MLKASHLETLLELQTIKLSHYVLVQIYQSFTDVALKDTKTLYMCTPSGNSTENATLTAQLISSSVMQRGFPKLQPFCKKPSEQS